MVNFIAWIAFILLEQKIKFYEKVCKNKDFCGIVMQSEKDNILEFNQDMKSDEMSYIIYAGIELTGKIYGCANNPENSLTTKIGKNIPCAFSISVIWPFDHIENKHTLYRGKDCTKTFC